MDTTDMSGQQHGRLTVLRRQLPNQNRQAMWLCQCACGGLKVTSGTALRTGRSLSCGCLQREVARKPRTHGMVYRAEYLIWAAMVQRCTNPRATGYQDYGARGVTVTPRWRDFAAFFADMGARPSKGHSLDRINNDGNYEPGNCRWSTRIEQARNTRATRWITAYGHTMSLAAWSEAHGVHGSGIRQRLDRGWSPERAVVPHIDERHLEET